MPYRMPPERGYDRSSRLLGRSLLGNPLRDFLADLATRDRVEFYDDFLGDTINLDNLALAQSQTSTNYAVAVATGGTISGTTASVTTASLSLITPAIWAGNNNASFECRMKVNTVASTWIMEAGLIDAVPGSSGPGIADIDNPGGTGATMTCGALFHINNAATHTAFAFGTVGGFTGQTFVTTLLTTSVSPIITPVADTYLTVKVQLLTDPDETGKSKAYLWINGRLVASHDTTAAGHVNGQQGLAGWIYFQTVAAAVKIHTIDYIRIAQDRSALMAAME